MGGLSVAEVHTSKEDGIIKIGLKINKKLVIAVACFAVLAVGGIVAFIVTSKRNFDRNSAKSSCEFNCTGVFNRCGFDCDSTGGSCWFDCGFNNKTCEQDCKNTKGICNSVCGSARDTCVVSC